MSAYCVFALVVAFMFSGYTLGQYMKNKRKKPSPPLSDPLPPQEE